MLMQKAADARMDKRSIFKAIFYFLLAHFGVRRLRGHSFFAMLLGKPAVVADFGAHRGEFFAAVKAEYPVSRALLIEANPALADSLKGRFGNEVNILHAALVGGNRKGTINFTLSANPESSSIFNERVAVYDIVNQVKVPTVDFADALRLLGGHVDLVKLDIEAAEVEVLQTAGPCDLAACWQLTVEFHDNAQSVTRHDVNCVFQRMRCEGYGIVNANWPHVDDVLFVNLRTMPTGTRFGFRCRMALVNGLFVLRGAFFWSIRLLKKIR
jgi:FkbM family methyltransferase